jgi:hypothetical protein
MDRSALVWSTATGTFSGSFVTNGCPNHIGAYQYGGVLDASVPVSGANCISQTIPAPDFSASPPIAAPLRGVIGYTISGGESIYGPMDAGFTLGQVCTNSRGVCPGGTDTRMCGAFLERACGTANLKGNTSASMHMLLSDCGGHAGYHVHEGLACEYSAAAAGHSAMVAVMLDGRAVFGQFESTGVKPADLDACGGHLGPTPALTIANSGGSVATTTYGATTSTYHYHVQSEAPFFLGCYGPTPSVTAAKALYPSCADSAAAATCSCSADSTACSCADGSSWSVCTSLGSYSNYRINCPIYAAGLSARNSSDPACAPCTGSCVLGADSGSGISGAKSGGRAAAGLALGAAALAAVAVAVVAAAAAG